MKALFSAKVVFYETGNTEFHPQSDHSEAKAESADFLNSLFYNC